MDPPNEPLMGLWLRLQDLIEQAENINTGDLRCRQLSLAITRLEEAEHWLDDIFRRIPGNEASW